MRRDFFPDRESDMLTFARVLADRLESEPGHFGIEPATVESFVQAKRAFAALFALAGSPATRTPVVTKSKQTARREMERQARQLARRLGTGVIRDDGTRRSLGLNVPRPRRRRVAPPDAAPWVMVRRAEGWTVTLELRDAQRAASRARPEGATGAIIFHHAGPRPPTEQDQWQLARLTSRRRVVLWFDPSLPLGTTIWIAARWHSRRYEQGPSSQPVRVRLGEGAQVASIGGPTGERAMKSPPQPAPEALEGPAIDQAKAA